MSTPTETHTKPTASTIYVDPQMARRVLARNTKNRPLSEIHVQRLMREMESGRWRYNGEAVKWSVENVLLDGQHRLTALSRMPDSFGPIPMLVVRGLPPESQDTMDQGRSRSAGDQLVISGLAKADSKVIAGAIRVYTKWTSGMLFTDNKRSKMSTAEVVEWAHTHPAELSMMHELLSPGLRRAKVRPSLMLAVMLRLRQVSADDQEAFASGLYTGAGLDAGSPILALRNRLDNIKEQKRDTSDRDFIGFIVTAWNAWRTGREVTRIQRPRNGTWTQETFPEPK